MCTSALTYTHTHTALFKVGVVYLKSWPRYATGQIYLQKVMSNIIRQSEVNLCVFRNAATHAIDQQLVYAGDEGGKLMALREVIRQVRNVALTEILWIPVLLIIIIITTIFTVIVLIVLECTVLEKYSEVL